MIRVVLPAHLRTLANLDREVQLDVLAPITQRSILDALEEQYPALSGTLRDHVTLKRRPLVRFFAAKNPGHLQGDELACLTEITRPNLTRAGERMMETPVLSA